MGDSDATPSEEELADDLPGLLPGSDSEDCDTSEEEYVPPKRRAKKRKERKQTQTVESNCRTKRKSNPKNKKARKIVARNTTYASKQKCADRDAVKEFLAHGDCGCDAKCIKVLQRLQDDGALDVRGVDIA